MINSKSLRKVGSKNSWPNTEPDMWARGGPLCGSRVVVAIVVVLGGTALKSGICSPPPSQKRRPDESVHVFLPRRTSFGGNRRAGHKVYAFYNTYCPASRPARKTFRFAKRRTDGRIYSLRVALGPQNQGFACLDGLKK